MTDPIICKIGGEEITLPLIMNFAQLERCWPAIKAMSSATDAVAQISAAISLISGVMLETKPELTPAKIKASLRVNRVTGTDERTGILRAADQLCLQSGLSAPQKDDSSGEMVPLGNQADPAA